jgi:CheY-like chemotaxis protein
MLCDRIAQGKTDKITVFADAACYLSDNKKYLESEVLERWWQLTHDEWERNGQHITVICPHPVNFDNEVAKHKVAQRHDVTIEFNFGARKNRMQVLIAEPELDLRILYSEYLRYLGLDITVADNGRKCLSLIREKGFDFVILDTHLQDIPPMQLISQIHSFVPNQRIMVTTTQSPDQIIGALESIGIGKENILSKPFELSRLFEAVQKIT